jgi:SAM-dependent MidA family methyltransferase
MAESLYGDRGFFRSAASAPADHFRTSAHVGPAFAGAITTVLTSVDIALGHPDRLDLVDIGAGRGELLTAMIAAMPEGLRERVRAIAVEVAPQPDGLDPAITWTDTPPDRVSGLVVATEWLDNVPLDIAEMTPDGWRTVLVDADGTESLGGEPDDAAWLDRWWPDGIRAEIGATRDAAWAEAVAHIDTGLALAIDYGHTLADRPALGTLAAFRNGVAVMPVPNGSCDLTAHIAADAVAAAGSAVAGLDAQVVRQTDALRSLGVTGRRPDLELARRDPAAYVRALSAASTSAELTDRSGLGAHYWIYQPVGIPLDRFGLSLGCERD